MKYPIAQLIQRDFGFEAWGNNTLQATSSYSISLYYFFHIQWPATIQTLNITATQKFRIVKSDMIAINETEFATITLNFNATIIAFHELAVMYLNAWPLLLDWMDSTPTLAWLHLLYDYTCTGTTLMRTFVKIHA